LRDANRRLLCVGCHKEAPTYGRGLAALVEAFAERKRPRESEAFASLLNALGPAEPPYSNLAAAIGNPPNPYALTLSSIFGKPPKPPSLFASPFGPPSHSLLDLSACRVAQPVARRGLIREPGWQSDQLSYAVMRRAAFL
jgi:hypothetical protein